MRLTQPQHLAKPCPKNWLNLDRKKKPSASIRVSARHLRYQSPQVVVYSKGYDIRIAEAAQASEEARSAKGRRNSWTSEQRLALFVLYRYYNVTWRSITILFNHMFYGELRKCGFNLDFSTRSIYIQMTDNSCIQEYSVVYNETPFPDNTSRWCAIRKRLENVARDQGIPLFQRVQESARRWAYHGKNRARLRARTPDEQRWGEMEYFNPDDGAARRRERSRNMVDNPRSIPAQIDEASFRLILSSGHQDFPPLFYRVYDEDSAGINQTISHHGTKRTLFRAGQFQFSGDPVPPPLLDEMYFKHSAATHFNIHPIHTPFISVTASLLRAIHILTTKSRIAGTNPVLAVINARTAATEQRVYSVGRLKKFIREKIDSDKKGYQGLCEWFVWGEISSKAIVGSFSLRELQDLTDSYPRLRDLLELDGICTHSNVGKASRALMARDVTLNPQIAAALGRIVRLMGLNANGGDATLLSGAVASLVDGWWIGGVPSRESGESFVHAASYRKLSDKEKETSMHAFNLGFRRGNDLRAKFSPQKVERTVSFGLSTSGYKGYEPCSGKRSEQRRRD